jgi:carbonic anhydrase/acetyltransferase-like protein (isoleucine patch superfamily)
LLAFFRVAQGFVQRAGSGTPTLWYRSISMTIRSYRGLMPRLGSGVFIAETATVIGDVVLGDDVSIWYSTVVRGDCCSIRIGARSNVQDNCSLHVTSRIGPLTLEEEVTVGHNAVVHACTVRRGALIGMNATVLDHADVGASALVAAGSVVLNGTVIPPATLWAGNPAKHRRDLAPDEVERLKTYWKNYLEYKAEYLGDEAKGLADLNAALRRA